MHRANKIKHILKEILRRYLKIFKSCMRTSYILSDVYSYWSSFYKLEEIMRYHSHNTSKEKENGKEKNKNGREMANIFAGKLGNEQK